MIYDASNDVQIFPFASFYNTEYFIDQVRIIGEWCQYKLKNLPELLELHTDFLTRQPYKYSKKICDDLLERLVLKEIFDFPKLDLMQESYIQAQLENFYGCEVSTDQVEWYKSSKEIFESFK
jgi:hypothetical protein